jgi:prepilin-type N-terminal cleavage/methylation domain-containing protein
MQTIPAIQRKAFTLVEMLLVIAIISILAAMAISNFSNASQDTREIIVRQQLAVMQEAQHHYVNKEIGRVTSVGGTPKSISQVMSDYNTATGAARYALFSGYLDEATRDNFDFASDGKLTTQIMRDTSKYLTLPDWTGDYPKVQLN